MEDGYSEIIQEQTGDNEYMYSVCMQWLARGSYYSIIHLQSKDYDEAVAYKRKFDAEYERFQDSLTETEIQRYDNVSYEKFYAFADDSLELTYWSEAEIAD